METIFEWDAEGGGHNLKALPYVMDWFERAREAVAAGEYEHKSDSIEERKLTRLPQVIQPSSWTFLRFQNCTV